MKWVVVGSAAECLYRTSTSVHLCLREQEPECVCVCRVKADYNNKGGDVGSDAPRSTQAQPESEMNPEIIKSNKTHSKFCFDPNFRLCCLISAPSLEFFSTILSSLSWTSKLALSVLNG